MSHEYSWEDAIFTTSEGTSIVLHPTLPTVVYPQIHRPRHEWDGLALLEVNDIIEIWEEEEEDEKASKGINAEMARVSGGIFGLFMSGVTMLPDLQAGIFPDPEPRRFSRNAVRHQRPIYFIEPSYDDEDWIDFLEQTAKSMSHWKKLLGMVRVGRRFRKRLKHHLSLVPIPPKELSDQYATAYALTCAWWDCKEWLVGEKLAHRRDQRFASRILGAAQDLSTRTEGPSTLLVPLFAPWVASIYRLIQTTDAEEISSTPNGTDRQEEE